MLTAGEGDVTTGLAILDRIVIYILGPVNNQFASTLSGGNPSGTAAGVACRCCNFLP